MQLLLMFFFDPQRWFHSFACRFSQLLHNCLINLHVFLEARIIENINFTKFDGRDSGNSLKGQFRNWLRNISKFELLPCCSLKSMRLPQRNRRPQGDITLFRWWSLHKRFLMLQRTCNHRWSQLSQSEFFSQYLLY